jgi:ribosomal protein L15E
LAALYGVATKNINKAVTRNLDRFPADFMFQLTADEVAGSRFQSGTLKIRQLMAPPVTPRRQIGFQARERRAVYRVRAKKGTA